MFDSDGVWDVDKGAASLNESLFGNLSSTSQKNKKQKIKNHENGGHLSANMIDNKPGKKRKKNEDVLDTHHQAKKLKQNVPIDVNKIETSAKSKKKHETSKNNIEEIDTPKRQKHSKIHGKKFKLSQKLNTEALGKNNEENKLNSGDIHLSVDNGKSDTSGGESGQKLKRKKRKRKISESDLERSESKKKKVSGGKVDDSSSLAEKAVNKSDKASRLTKKSGGKSDKTSPLVKNTESGDSSSLTRKEKRNRKRSRTCSKNKYEHLSLSNKNISTSLEKNGASKINTKSESQVKSRKGRKTVDIKREHRENKLQDDQQDSKLTIDCEHQTVQSNGNEIVNGSEKKKQKKTKKSLGPSVKGATVHVKQKNPIRHGFDVEKLKEVLMSSEKIKSGMKKKVNKKLFSSRSTSSDSDSEHECIKSNDGMMTIESAESNAEIEDLEDGRKGARSDGPSLTERMHGRLNAARFRYLNEHMYSTTGSEAAQMFAEDEDAFRVYHDGYQSQVSKWPVDPLDVIRKQIMSRNKSPNMVIADMGCGSARLAKCLKKVKVHSFDLVAVNKLVTACEMSKVPLSNGAVDVVVFCLSLMGTNLVDYLLEANRILKKGGVMKIAEVESRFQKVGAFIVKVEKLGFEIISKDVSHKMFYLFDFKKKKTVAKNAGNPQIELEPCLYKKR